MSPGEAGSDAGRAAVELRQVEYVLAVIDHGSFTAGAEAAGVTQPSLSEGVRRLETGGVVQVPLFVNVGDKVKVDPRDRRYISRADVEG